MTLDWLAELDELLTQFPEVGAKHDIGAMTMDELWGLLQTLGRRPDAEEG